MEVILQPLNHTQLGCAYVEFHMKVQNLRGQSSRAKNCQLTPVLSGSDSPSEHHQGPWHPHPLPGYTVDCKKA